MIDFRVGRYGYVVRVSEVDAELMHRDAQPWRAVRVRSRRRALREYLRVTRKGVGSPSTVHLAREILSRVLGRPLTRREEVGFVVQPDPGGRLIDYRRENLRLMTRSLTAVYARKMTLRMGRRLTSRHRGVTWDKQHRRWLARCKLHPGARWSTRLGYYAREDDAALAYNAAARRAYGDRARLNAV